MKAKSIVITSLITIIIGALLMLSGMNTFEAETANSVYQVYLDGKKIGVISSDQELYNLINEDQSEIKDTYEVDNVYPPNGFEIVKYNTYKEDLTNTDEVYNTIKEEKSFTVKGYAINIKREVIDEDAEVDPNAEPEYENEQIYVLDDGIFDTAIRSIVTTFIDAKEFEDYLNNNQAAIVDVGQTLESIFFEEDITIRESYISTDEKIYTDVKELSQYLLFGTNNKSETYTVKSGDTIESISESHKLNVQEFLIANPTFTNADNLLAEGTDVVIALINPVLSLTYDMVVVEDQEVSYKTETKYDASKYASYSKTEQKGEKGIQRITKSVRVINGAEAQGSTIDDSKTQVIKEPVTEIITRGKASAPGISGKPIDTGTEWAWPTNQPYTITSPFGYRWGKLHEAIDISGTGYGSPIYAATDGTVIGSGTGVFIGGGVSILIENSSGGYYTVYAHLSKTLVKEGQKVTRGQKIGLMGNTGTVSPRPTKANPYLGTHLHFGVYKGRPYRGGVPIDPRRFY